MKRSTSQRDAVGKYHAQDTEAPSTLLQSLAARVWHDVTDGAGVVRSRTLSGAEEKAAEGLYMQGVDSAEAARLRRIARLKKEAAEAKKKGGKP